MSHDINYKNNPLHGVSLKNLLIEIVDYYGFDILYAYLAINCFNTNPSIESSVNFLKKTVWAREKVEAFYLYEFKSLPRASSEQFTIPPRDRIIPTGQISGKPRELSLEDAQRLQEKRVKKAAEHSQDKRYRSNKKNHSKQDEYYKNQDDQPSYKSNKKSSHSPTKSNANPWDNTKIKPES